MTLALPVVLWLVYYFSGGTFERDVVLGLFVLLTPIVIMIGMGMDGAMFTRRSSHLTPPED